MLAGILCAGLSALPSFAQADPSAASPAAATTMDGRLKIAIVAENRSAFPASTTLFCTARADITKGGAAGAYSYRYYYAKATVTTAQVSCTVEIPYRVWVNDPAEADMWVLPAISASPLDPGLIIPLYSFVAVLPRTELSVTFPSIVFPLPRDGATTVKIVRSFI
ncbi:hypothetical protein CQW49_00640 [Methylosinus trichosporium OB3b]|uniref:Uncharacterized protein n=1 Tax=Methylosinus trichosporium (strain ATCC 35070 / NCIMB 11131 / UNIQEM 75 / OB3b) TaxID=595536 RepID=A0A2D2CUN8_METT3|nr:hypothetical protein CQW49_00640 [Methylosinus trichosporium OB3b]OBS54454.1 hypothetical protein A8B73_00355 [Methylosinus sp. 3S-1]